MTVKNVGPLDARIVIIGEAPGADEMGRGQPFVGIQGSTLDRMLGEAGIARPECRVGYVCQHRPPANRIDPWMPVTKEAQEAAIKEGWPIVKGRPVHPYVARGYNTLMEELDQIKPSIIIVLGNLALWALTGLTSVSKWRGSTLTITLPGGHSCVCLPTYDPAAVLRQWSTRPCVVQDLRRAAAVARQGLDIPEWHFQVRPTLPQVQATLHMLLDKAREAQPSAPLKLSVDIETRAGHIACVGIAWNKTDAICIPILCVERPAGYWTEDEEAEIVWLLHLLLCHNNVLIVGQNFIYDAQYFIRHWCFAPKRLRDTMVGWHVCYPGTPKALDYISSMTNQFYIYWKDDGKTWDKKGDDDEDQYWRYNCEDCIRTFECDEVIQAVVDRLGIRGPHDFQQSLFGPVLRTMVRGVRVDETRRKWMLGQLKNHASELQREVEEMVGYALNPKSPKQMQNFFYKEMGLPPIRNRKTKALTCDDEALKKLGEREILVRPITDRIATIRSCETVASNALKASAIGFDGRIHCSYNVTGTVTFRFSSSTDAFGSGMNLQNITSGDKDD